MTQSSGKSVHTPTKYENNGRVINEATVAKKAFTGISWYRLHTPACNSLIQVEYQNRKLFFSVEREGREVTVLVPFLRARWQTDPYLYV